MSPSNWRLSDTIALLLALAVPNDHGRGSLGHVATLRSHPRYIEPDVPISGIRLNI
jgi:hypothetical protein